MTRIYFLCAGCALLLLGACGGKSPDQLVHRAASTLNTLKAEDSGKRLLDRASGVLLVPDYVRVAAGVGFQRGDGVLIARHDGGWSDPVFYDVDGYSVGLELGAEGGSIALVLVGDKALDKFAKNDTFSMNATSDLTLFDYSELLEGEPNEDDGVVFWSDTKGMFVGATFRATDVSLDEDENEEYYGREVTAAEVLRGKVSDDMRAVLEVERIRVEQEH